MFPHFLAQDIYMRLVKFQTLTLSLPQVLSSIFLSVLDLSVKFTKTQTQSEHGIMNHAPVKDFRVRVCQCRGIHWAWQADPKGFQENLQGCSLVWVKQTI
jgi:hypothetical protein